MFGPDQSYRLMPQASTYKKFGVDIYPHPYFDPASYYIPPTIREAFRWCIYLFLTNSIIGTLVRKKSAYVVTGLKYHANNPVAIKIWKEVLEDNLRIREFEYLMKIDHEVFGNAFCSIIYPFDRYLKCSYCGYENFIKSVPWTYTGDHFVATCKNCKSRAAMQINDHYIRNRNRVKLHRWFPDYIDPKRNPITGACRYILRIPRSLRFRIMNPKINKIFVEDTPKEILEAITLNKVIELDPNNIYHWKQESISMEDDSLGIPPLMHVIKDIWLNQVYKKGQESVALEHVHPLTMLSPAPPPGGQSPHMNVDLLTWRNNMQNIISLWRRDPTALFPVPFPVQVSQLRGDAAALSLANDLQLSRQDIAGGMDVPADFLYGNLTWCHSLDHGLVSTSWGMLYLRELAGKEEGRRTIWCEVPGHEEPSDAVLAHNTGQKRSVRLITELGNEAYPSEEHKYYRLNSRTLEPEWVRAADLAVGDHIAIRPGANVWSCEVPSLLQPSEEVAHRGERKLPAEMTMDLAGLMGALIAEGSITGSSRPSIRMNDREIMEDLKEKADRIFGSTHALRIAEPSELSDNPRYSLEFDRNLEKGFLELNLGTGYAEDKRIPAVIRRSPKTYIFEFLRYLFEGDGGPTKNDIRYTSKSKRLCEEVQAVLLNAGIISHLYSGERKTSAGVVIPMYTLTIFGGEMARFRKTIGFVSKKKQRRLTLALRAWEKRSQNRSSVRGRIPGGKEALARFVEENRIGRMWVKDTTIPVLAQEKYTIKELARIFGKSVATVLGWVRKGLRASLVSGVSGRFSSFEVTKHDLAEFIKQHGLRRRVGIKVPQYEMRKDHLKKIDLSYIAEKDPALAKNLALLSAEDLVWVQIKEKTKGPVLPMGDLTVEDTHSYLIDGVVVHNSGGNVSLRVLENMFINSVGNLNQLLKWITKNIGQYLGLPECAVEHQDFKMADDVAQKNIALSLRASGTISDQTVLEELDFDYEEEKERRKREQQERITEMERQAVAQAQIDAKIAVIRAKADMEIQEMQQARMQAMQEAQAQPLAQEEINGEIMQGSMQPQGTTAAQVNGAQQSQAMVDMQANNFIKSTPPDQMEYQIALLQQQNPLLARIVRQKLATMQKFSIPEQPLPEQRPPRRGPETAMI